MSPGIPETRGTERNHKIATRITGIEEITIREVIVAEHTGTLVTEKPEGVGTAITSDISVLAVTNEGGI